MASKLGKVAALVGALTAASAAVASAQPWTWFRENGIVYQIENGAISPSGVLSHNIAKDSGGYFEDLNKDNKRQPASERYLGSHFANEAKASENLANTLRAEGFEATGTFPYYSSTRQQTNLFVYWNKSNEERLSMGGFLFRQNPNGEWIHDTTGNGLDAKDTPMASEFNSKVAEEISRIKNSSQVQATVPQNSLETVLATSDANTQSQPSGNMEYKGVSPYERQLDSATREQQISLAEIYGRIEEPVENSASLETSVVAPSLTDSKPSVPQTPNATEATSQYQEQAPAPTEADILALATRKLRSVETNMNLSETPKVEGLNGQSVQSESSSVEWLTGMPVDESLADQTQEMKTVEDLYLAGTETFAQSLDLAELESYRDTLTFVPSTPEEVEIRRAQEKAERYSAMQEDHRQDLADNAYSGISVPTATAEPVEAAETPEKSKRTPLSFISAITFSGDNNSLGARAGVRFGYEESLFNSALTIGYQKGISDETINTTSTEQDQTSQAGLYAVRITDTTTQNTDFNSLEATLSGYLGNEKAKAVFGVTYKHVFYNWLSVKNELSQVKRGDFVLNENSHSETTSGKGHNNLIGGYVGLDFRAGPVRPEINVGVLYSLSSNQLHPYLAAGLTIAEPSKY